MKSKIYKCKYCNFICYNSDTIEEDLWGHIQMHHENIFEDVQNFETPNMIEECYQEGDIKMKEKIITAFQDNHRDLVISKKTGQFEDELWNTGYETAMLFVLRLMGINREQALNMNPEEERITRIKLVECTDRDVEYGIIELKNINVETFQNKIYEIKKDFLDKDIDDWTVDDVLEKLPNDWQWERLEKEELKIVEI